MKGSERVTTQATSSTGTTEALRDRAKQVIPGGVSSNVRLAAPRVFFARGAGPRLWDTDGREYVDYLLGQGPAFLGHGRKEVVDAVAEATRHGMVFGAQHSAEIEAAERVIAALGWPDQVRFGVSGTESVQAALRVARAATRRRRVVRFAGSYHGWIDNVLMNFGGEAPGPASAGQPADTLGDWHVSPFNDVEAFTDLMDRQGDQVAAVIVEPMMCNFGAIPGEVGFLQALRRLTTAHGSVLIFDEVITGFRLAFGGAAERFGVTPDLAVYGKALAGGWPVSALAGRRDLMERFGTGEVNHSGTFNASVMASAAVNATLTLLADDPPYDRIDDHGQRLMAGLVELGRVHGVPLRAQGLPAAFHVSFGPPEPVCDLAGLDALDLDRYARFAHVLADHGVWVAPRGIWFVSAAHTDAELTDVVERVDRALREEAR